MSVFFAQKKVALFARRQKHNLLMKAAIGPKLRFRRETLSLQLLHLCRAQNDEPPCSGGPVLSLDM